MPQRLDIDWVLKGITMEHALAIPVGIGLAASCGFRVFVPMLVVSLAARAGYLQLSDGFAWLDSWAAVSTFALATVIEVAAFYIPWVDNLLDTVASPAAAIAGALLFAATVAHLDPLLQWSLAIIAGGGSAALVQGTTVVARGASTATTAGLGNFVVNTFETLASVLFPLLAIFVPILALVLLALLLIALAAVARRVLRQSRSYSSPRRN